MGRSWKDTKNTQSQIGTFAGGKKVQPKDIKGHGLCDLQFSLLRLQGLIITKCHDLTLMTLKSEEDKKFLSSQTGDGSQKCVP